MNNLEHIFNDELELDEAIFAAGKQKAKNVFNDVKAGVKKVDNAEKSMSARKVAIKQTSKYKAAFLKSVRLGLIEFDNTKGKGEDGDTGKYKYYMKNALTNYGVITKTITDFNDAKDDGEEHKDIVLKKYWERLHIAVKKGNLKSIKVNFAKATEAFNKAYGKKIVKPLFGSESKPESKNDDQEEDGLSDGWKRFTQPEIIKAYTNTKLFNNLSPEAKPFVVDIYDFHEIFNKSFSESIDNNFINILTEDILNEYKYDNIKRAIELINKFNNKSSNIGKLLHEIPNAEEMIKDYIKNAEGDIKNKLLKANNNEVEKETEKENIPNGGGSFNKKQIDPDKAKLESLIDIFKNQGFEEKSENMAKEIKNSSPDLFKNEEPELIAAALLIINGKIAKTKNGNFKLINGEIKKVDESNNQFNKFKLYENLNIKDVINKLPDYINSLKKVMNSKKNNNGNKKSSQSIVKKKIEKLQAMYGEDENDPKAIKFRQKINQALKAINITPKSNSRGINATRILQWLDIAKNSSLKVESFNIEFELYKEDIVNILWDNRYIL